jgi:arylsulfatase A-like enzyme
MSVDDMVGELHRSLQETGELGDTLAIFVSDNGLFWGEHGGLPIKDLPYPASARIPLLVSWPGQVAAGAEDPRLTANIDLAPTILDAAGREAIVRRLDGNSLLRGGWERDRLLLEYFGLADAIPAWAGLITPIGQYTEYQDPAAGGLFRELYDFRTDPWELTNPFGDDDPANDPDVSAVADLLHRDMTCRGPSCP